MKSSKLKCSNVEKKRRPVFQAAFFLGTVLVGTVLENCRNLKVDLNTFVIL